MAAVSVVVVTFNSEPDLLARCLRSVAANLEEIGQAPDVVLFDNASDEPPSTTELPVTRVVRSPENVGFARAVNAAVRLARGSQVLVLNPDAVLCPGSLGRFVDAARHCSDDTLLSGWLIRDGEIEVNAYLLWFFTTGALLRHRRCRRRLDRAERAGAPVVEVEKCCGAALFARRQTLIDLGPFHERFFLYGEDADLSVRAGIAGVALRAVPRAVVHHRGSASQVRHPDLVERCRADAAIRLGSYHLPRWASMLQRLEYLLIALLGIVVDPRSSGRRSVRARRVAEVWRWAMRHDATVVRPRGGGAGPMRVTTSSWPRRARG